MGSSVSKEQQQLWDAACKEDIDGLKKALALGADINARDKDGKTAVYLSVKHDSRGCVRELLAQGAETDTKTNEGRSALHISAQSGNLLCVSLLVEQGGASLNVQDNFLCTPLHKAAEKGRTRVVEYLLDHNANPNVLDINAKLPSEVAIKRRARDLLREAQDPDKIPSTQARREFFAKHNKGTTWSSREGH